MSPTNSSSLLLEHTQIHLSHSYSRSLLCAFFHTNNLFKFQSSTQAITQQFSLSFLLCYPSYSFLQNDTTKVHFSLLSHPSSFQQHINLYHLTSYPINLLISKAHLKMSIPTALSLSLSTSLVAHCRRIRLS